MAARRGRRSASATLDDINAPIPESLKQAFADLGLSPYEARVLLSLLRLGSANTLQLAQLSGVPRTSTYQVLEALRVKRLAARLPGDGPAVWAAPKRDEVFERLEAVLEAAQAERLAQHRAQAAHVRELLAESFPEAPSVAVPFVHLLGGPAQAKRAYEEMLAAAAKELVMFTRPPYAWVVGPPNQRVIDMLARGVSARVLYQADKWEEPEAHGLRQEIQAYHQAGVVGRLTDHLPIKLVVVDRRVALVGMSDPVAPEATYPTTLLVEHPGYAQILAESFERRWETARPLTIPPVLASDPELEALLADR